MRRGKISRVCRRRTKSSVKRAFSQADGQISKQAGRQASTRERIFDNPRSGRAKDERKERRARGIVRANGRTGEVGKSVGWSRRFA